jgi:hypothetical protein
MLVEPPCKLQFSCATAVPAAKPVSLYAITAFGMGPHVNPHYHEAPYVDGVIGPVRKVALPAYLSPS